MFCDWSALFRTLATHDYVETDMYVYSSYQIIRVVIQIACVAGARKRMGEWESTRARSARSEMERNDFLPSPSCPFRFARAFSFSFSFLVSAMQVIVVIVIVRKRKLSNRYDYDSDSYDAVYHDAHDFDFRFTLDFNALYNYSKIQQVSRWRAWDQTNDKISLLRVVRSEDFKQGPTLSCLKSEYYISAGQTNLLQVILMTVH